ncbi:hypothetical protein FQA39_LY17923 [Lamprigera yunnana]|nr:hypothetical protein FQA39_LY17923 [Lamprigera yunnana]
MYTIKFILALLASIMLYKASIRTLFDICEIESCPYCFGTNLCSEFETRNILLMSNSFLEFFSNYISVKNVFYGSYGNRSVVMKKLGHDFELGKLSYESAVLNVSENRIIDLLTSENVNFKLCSIGAAKKLLKAIGVYPDLNLINLWSILKINAEPIVIQLLRAEDDWPVPHYFGSCGRLIVENNAGFDLNTFASANWHIRSKLALQLLQAAKNFTNRHSDFRFYLTDVSPDNIAVDENLKVTFVDLENVIVAERNSELKVHHSQNFGDDFAFLESEICRSYISDHNYFSICKLLLSKEAPWPMMKGGLLHSPPDDIKQNHSDLFMLIEACSYIHISTIDCIDAIDKMILFLENL